MSWLWKSTAEAARLADRREARFVKIAREAHERARGELGPQKLKPRDWEHGSLPTSDRRDVTAPGPGRIERT